LSSLITTTIKQEPEPQQEEVIQVEVFTEQSPIEQDDLEIIQEPVTSSDKEPVTSSETDSYIQLLSLFNNLKVEPSKVKDKQKLRDEILDILIPKVKAGQIKGRMQRGKQKLEEVAKMITNSRTKEQLASDLVTWLDGYVAKREKRYGVNTNDVEVVTPQVEEVINEDFVTQQEEITTNLEVMASLDEPQQVDEVEHYFVENKIIIPGVIHNEYESNEHKNTSITSCMVTELVSKNKNIFFDLKNNKKLTPSQAKLCFTRAQHAFAMGKISEGLEVQLVKGFENEKLSIEAIICNASNYNNIEYYMSDNDEVVIRGTRDKRHTSTTKQHDYFESLGGEFIIKNYKRRFNTFSLSEMSCGIALRLAQVPTIMQDKYLK